MDWRESRRNEGKVVGWRANWRNLNLAGLSLHEDLTWKEVYA